MPLRSCGSSGLGGPLGQPVDQPVHEPLDDEREQHDEQHLEQQVHRPGEELVGERGRPAVVRDVPDQPARQPGIAPQLPISVAGA